MRARQRGILIRGISLGCHAPKKVTGYTFSEKVGEGNRSSYKPDALGICRMNCFTCATGISRVARIS